MFYVDWSNPEFPAIRPAEHDGDPLDVAIISVLRHHLEAAQSHYRAVLGVLRDYTTDKPAAT